MSQSVNPATTHDDDLLPLKSAQAFREWLERSGAPTRDAKTNEIGRGILYWVMLKNWISVDLPRTERGTHVLTHRRLRGLINDFLLNPLVSAVRIASSPSRQALTAVQSVQLPAARSADVDLIGTRIAVPVESVTHVGRSQGATLCIDPVVPGADQTVTIRPSGECAESCSGHCALQVEASAITEDDLEQMLERVHARSQPAMTQAQRERLEDLRDDFALYAPLSMRKDESLADHALRRWEYAKVMMETRPH